MKLKRLLSLTMGALLCSCLGAFTASAAEPVLASPEGDYLEFTDNIKKSDTQTLTFLFYKVKKCDYVVQPGDQVEYDYIINDEMPGLGHIDLQFQGAASMGRDLGFSDTEGNGFHTGTDLTSLGVGVWVHRVVPIAVAEDDVDDPKKATVGRTLNEFQVAAHPADNALEYTEKTVKVLYDNVVITNNGVVKYVIFQNAADIDPAYVKKSHSQECEGTVEVKTMSAEDAAKVKADQLKAIEEASKAEEERIAKMSEEAASREAAKASEEASIAESESIAASEAAVAAESQSVAASEQAAKEAGQKTTVIIISVVGGVVVIAVIVAIVIVSSKKKKK